MSKDQSSKKKKKELWLTDPVISQSNLSTVQPCSVFAKNVQPTTSAAPFVFVAKKSVAKPYTGLYPFCPTPRRNSPPPPEEPTSNLTSEFNFDETKSEASSSGTGKFRQYKTLFQRNRIFPPKKCGFCHINQKCDNERKEFFTKWFV